MFQLESGRYTANYTTLNFQFKPNKTLRQETW